ncbi:MAG: 4-alpha-glucanotransferase [Pseudomonadota bacterium]
MRRAGILLHPTSLPSAHRDGALGMQADAFLAFLHGSGMHVWQMLPLGPVHEDRSPYRALSLNAGGEHLIDVRRLRGEAWMRCGGGWARPGKRERFLALAARRFMRHAPSEEQARFRAFVVREREWLEPYCAFRVLWRRFRRASWPEWPSSWRDGAEDAYARLSHEVPRALERECVVQFLFDRQWQALRRAAAPAGIELFGDIAFYPAPDSVDVWRHRHLFQLDAQGRPTATAGVPPDAFAREGQAWGAAVYDWERLAQDDFAWWCARLRVQGRRFDLLRLDHFRGFEAYWSIPAGAPPSAGEWRPGPGAALFRALRREPALPALVAEDLGTITSKVEALRLQFALPGTRVLQFAFDGDPDNPHLPRNHETDAVAYTGTHDNEPLAGWWRGLAPRERERALAMLDLAPQSGPEALRDALLASPALLAILPMQDVLGLGSLARMNVPGRPHGNWRWRLHRDQFGSELAQRVRATLKQADRFPYSE